MKKRLIAIICDIILALAAACASCCYTAAQGNARQVIPAAIIAFLAANILPGVIDRAPTFRLRVCDHGARTLRIFVISSVLAVCIHIFLAFRMIPDDWRSFVWSAVICIAAQLALLTNGVVSVYCASVQLGIKHRAAGIICAFIPLANVIVLHKIIRVVTDEVDFESDRIALNKSREKERVCATKYPVLLVHGVCFRDSKILNYWGRIPRELERNGARVFYGNHQSARSVEDSANELADRIRQIVRDTGCEKVNIIAHSKGGLDCRCALAHCDIAQYVASLTTVNTPHRGCEFADYLLEKVPESVQKKVESTYNGAMRRLGDDDPDFMAAMRDLTYGVCVPRDAETELPEGIYARSVGSVLCRGGNATFPQNLSYHLAKYFDGENDGLVAERSFKWGEDYTLLTPSGRRGISHTDMIDMNRENIPGFDVREFYVGLVSDLRQRGL